MKLKVTSRKFQLLLVALSALLAFLHGVGAQQQGGRLLTAQEVKQLPAKAKRYALVIGVDEYQDTQISRLSGATNDAKALAGALVRYAAFPADQVILLASDQPQERQPNRGNILQYLSNLKGVVPEDGLLLVSFAGHGIERGGRGFLCPSDARIGGSIALLESTAVAVDTVREWIRDTGVKQVLIVLDACRNNPSGRGESENKLTDSFAKKFNFDIRNQEVTAFATLYATDVGHVAYEYKEKKQGYFTWWLIEGLKGGAANERGEVTLGGLVRYLQEQVPKRIRLDLGQEKSQKPYAIVGGYKADELVISVTGNVTTVDPAAIELEFWNSIKTSSDVEDYKEYLTKYPNGQFASLARNRISVTSQQLLQQANTLYNQKMWAEAEAFYKKAVRIGIAPDVAQWHTDFGVTLYSQGKLAEAEVEFRRATELEPNQPNWYYNLGLTQLGQKKWVEYEATQRRLTKLEPNNAGKYYDLGVALYNQQKWAEAERALREAVRLDPASIPSQNLLKKVVEAQKSK